MQIQFMYRFLKAAVIATVVISLSACATPVWQHVQTGDIAKLNTAIAKGDDVNASQAGADVDLWAPLHFAVKFNPDAITPLLAAGARVDQPTTANQFTPLHIAAEIQPSVVPQLIAAGADVNARDKFGNTPLLFSRTPQTTSFLIEAGADVNASNQAGNTPLILSKDPETSSFLIKAGADVNLAGGHNITPLINAALSNPEAVPLLLAAGADVNAHTQRGITALFNAALTQPEIIPLLLEAGADMAATSTDAYWIKIPVPQADGQISQQRIDFPPGVTALDFAKATGNEGAFQGHYAAANHRALESVRASQACRLNEGDWVYKSKSCLNGVAHGNGIALNTQGLRFEGKFRKGDRVHGKIYLDEELMYDGGITAGRPHGEGICMHEGKPERCEYYEGERVDTLFKIRLENEKQLLAMEAERNKLEQLQNGSRGSNAGTGAASVMQREATRAIMQRAFNSLF